MIRKLSSTVQVVMEGKVHTLTTVLFILCLKLERVTLSALEKVVPARKTSQSTVRQSM